MKTPIQKLLLLPVLIVAFGLILMNQANADSSTTVVVWGLNDYGQTNVPAGLTNVTAIAGGRSFSVALKNDHTVVAWGRNDYGQTNVPAGLTNVTAIAAGGYHVLALKGDGTVVAWGLNTYGQASGTPYGPASANPISLNGQTLTNVTAIAAGDSHSVALKSDGTVAAWGINLAGQITGTYVYPIYAVTVNPVVLNGQTLTNMTAIATGVNDSIAWRIGTVLAWGDNTYGQTNIPIGLTNVIAIAAGNNHVLALKSDGTIVTWGDNTYGQANIPAGLTNVTAIATGQYYSVALKSNGTVLAWGDNTYGQTNIPVGLTNVTTIATGYFDTMALIGTAPQPLSLNIASVGNQSILFWPTSATNYVLQSTTNLASPNWVTASDAVPVIAMTVTNTSPMRFFRIQPQ